MKKTARHRPFFRQVSEQGSAWREVTEKYLQIVPSSSESLPGFTKKVAKMLVGMGLPHQTK